MRLAIADCSHGLVDRFHICKACVAATGQGRDGVVNAGFSQQVISQQVICHCVIGLLLHSFLIVSDGFVCSAILIEHDSQVIMCSGITNLDR